MILFSKNEGDSYILIRADKGCKLSDPLFIKGKK